VATINMPPLCERPGDILPLAQHFIDIYSVKMKMSDISLAADAQSALLSYEWPGNIRELENVIHFALIVCQGQLIRAEDLKLVATLHRNSISVDQKSDHKTSASPGTASAAVQSNSGSTSASTVRETLYQRLDGLIGELISTGEPELFDSVEGSLIRNVFKFCGQNQVQSAKVLGISRNILRTHLKRFGLIRFDTTVAHAESSASSIV
jgi:sigma-54-specific transcriptional regulator